MPSTVRPMPSSAAAATTPIRRTRLNSKDCPSPRRGRLNSRDGLPSSPLASFAPAFDMTSSIYSPGFPSSSNNNNTLGWCLVYLTALGLLQLLSIALIGPLYSTTLTNVLHTLLTILSLHWIKGQPFDDTGSQAGLTLWEQLLVQQTQDDCFGAATTSVNSNHRRTLQSWLLLVPTVLTYAACVQCQYNAMACSINVASWVVVLVAKLPAMKGVRIFGINRTVGIDDDFVAANKKTSDSDLVNMLFRDDNDKGR
jgi:hypothetical protein